MVSQDGLKLIIQNLAKLRLWLNKGGGGGWSGTGESFYMEKKIIVHLVTFQLGGGVQAIFWG